MLHGKIAAQKAEETAKKTFGKGSFGDDLPTVNLNKSNIEKGINIIKLLHFLTSRLHSWLTYLSN